MGYFHICNTNRGCEGETINCPPGEFCNVQCTGFTYACSGSVVNCPADQSCTVQCNGATGACNGAIINCNTGSCFVECLGSMQGCAYATINGAASNGLNVRCENMAACTYAKIYCSTGDNCMVPCRTRSACQMAEIYGATNRSLTVVCDDDWACDGILIDARSSSELLISDCASGDSTCRGITVYCPPKVLGDKKCTINGDDGLYGNNEYPFSFYAINGFADIHFIVNGKSSDYTGTMYCTTSYGNQCDLSSTGFECDPSGNTLCNEGNPDATTNEPTNSPISPSMTPSYSPITPIPTTSQPSPDSTDQPSSQPSGSTTDNPTSNPSEHPTEEPSNQPSYSPSNPITTNTLSTISKITSPSVTETTTTNQTRVPIEQTNTQGNLLNSSHTLYNQTKTAKLDHTKSTTVGNVLQIPESEITSTETISSTKSTVKDVNEFLPPSSVQQTSSAMEYAVIIGSSIILCGCCIGIIFHLLRTKARKSAIRRAFGEKEKQAKVPSSLESIHSNSVKSISAVKSDDKSMKVYGKNTNQSIIVNIRTRGNNCETGTRGYTRDSGSEQHSICTLGHITGNGIDDEGVIVPRKDRVALPQTLNDITSGKTSIGTDNGDV